jgi:hypothetical protein
MKYIYQQTARKRCNMPICNTGSLTKFFDQLLALLYGVQKDENTTSKNISQNLTLNLLIFT